MITDGENWHYLDVKHCCNKSLYQTMIENFIVSTVFTHLQQIINSRTMEMYVKIMIIVI